MWRYYVLCYDFVYLRIVEASCAALLEGFGLQTCFLKKRIFMFADLLLNKVVRIKC